MKSVLLKKGYYYSTENYLTDNVVFGQMNSPSFKI